MLVEKAFELGFNKLVNRFGDEIPSKIEGIEKK